MFKYQIIKVEDNTLLVDNSKYKNKSNNPLRHKQKTIAAKYKRNKIPLLEESFLVEWETNPDLIIQNYVIEEDICKISYILPKDVMYLDPPEGWKYGFPKLFINFDGTKPESIKQFLLNNEYSLKLIESFGDFFTCKMFSQSF